MYDCCLEHNVFVADGDDDDDDDDVEEDEYGDDDDDDGDDDDEEKDDEDEDEDDDDDDDDEDEDEGRRERGGMVVGHPPRGTSIVTRQENIRQDITSCHEWQARFFIHRFDGKRQEEDVLQTSQSNNSRWIMLLKEHHLRIYGKSSKYK